MSKHIGILGCSAEGAALCYRTICLEGAAILGRNAHPEITMHTYPLSEYMKGGPKKWAELMLWSSRKLEKAGADFIICPDNTIHLAFDKVVSKSSLPWLHIAEEVARARIDRIIFDELVNGLITPVSRRYFTQVIARLKRRGCDGVVLGCTEIPLIVTQEHSTPPILDSTRLLARAALRKAVENSDLARSLNQ